MDVAGSRVGLDEVPRQQAAEAYGVFSIALAVFVL